MAVDFARLKEGSGPTVRRMLLGSELREIDNPLSRRLLNGQVRAGQHVDVTAEDGSFEFTTTQQHVDAG